MGSLDRFGPLGKNVYVTIEGIRDPIRRKIARHESSYEEHVQNRNLKAEKLIALLEKKKNVASILINIIIHEQQSGQVPCPVLL